MVAANDIDTFIRERDETLLSGALDRWIAFYRKHYPDWPPLANREEAETALHEARLAAPWLPMETRLASRRWLQERGINSQNALGIDY